MLDFTASPHGERFVRELQRDDFFSHPSAEVFADHFSVDFNADDTMFIVVGTDSGLLVRWLATQVSGNGSTILFVEMDDHHDAILAELPVLPDDTPVQICKASEVEQTVAANDIDRWFYGGKVVLVESMACYLNRSERYAALARRLKTQLAERSHRAKLRLNGCKFTQAGIQNLTENRRPAASIGTIGQGRTAMVLGSGPSLDDHLDWITANREHLFVMAAARTVGKLGGSGITPDAVMAVDPHDIFYDISKHALALENTLLVNAYHVVPALLQQWPGPSVYIGRAMAWPSELTDDAANIMSQGSTVTHAALWVAHCWGFSQVLLSGFDLCYAPGGATHASGSPEMLCAGLTIAYDSQVTTYSGRRAGTSIGFKLAREELEHIGQTIADAGTRVFNLAAEAAQVESIGHRELDKVVLEGTRPTIELANDSREAAPYWQGLTRELHAAARGLRALRTGCKKAQTLLGGLHGSNGRAPDPRCKGKLDVLERDLNRRQERWMYLIKGYAALEFMGTIAPRGFEVQTDEELEAWGRNYYRIIDTSAKQLLDQVDAARERVERRLDELAKVPDVPALIDYWTKDGTVGRIRFALDIDALEPADRARLAEAERWLREHLCDTDTTRARQISAQKDDPHQLLRTIALLFGEREHGDLARLAQAFDQHGERYALLADWAFAHLAELEEDRAAALQCYSAIIDRHALWLEDGKPVPEGQESLLEGALLRVTRLQLAANEPDGALEALSLLSQLSPAYAPRQAKLLTLMDRQDEAITLLQASLQGSMRDWRIAEQLAEVYASIDADEAAKLARTMARRLRSEGPGQRDEPLDRAA